MAGNKSLVAISEWCEDSSQELLCRLGARISPGTGLRIPPSYATIRRATMAVDADEFDRIVNTWAGAQADYRGKTRATGDGATRDRDDTTDPGSFGSGPDEGEGTTTGADLIGVAVDSKAVRGATREDGTQVQLPAALRHDTGMVIGQANVENDKTNEIVAFPVLIEPLDLAGRVVTADAMHTQMKAAKLISGKGGHFIFGVKQNQPKLWDAAIEASNSVDIEHPQFETEHRGQGRIDRHRGRHRAKSRSHARSASSSSEGMRGVSRWVERDWPATRHAQRSVTPNCSRRATTARRRQSGVKGASRPQPASG
ncbi:MAG: ISAs1 family transposase [Acidimicrobiales bacterium]